MANFQVNLLFKADTTAATNNIQQLGQLLSDISTKTQIGVDNGSLAQAVSSAQQLSVHLQNAVNQNTGKLDLSKLNSSLKSAGTDLQTLTTRLQAAGPAGQQAFLKVATAIASAETPMLRINQRLRDFGITLANTVKWQIASTAIHGISGMLSSAVGHAEDLNRALNDIRIVTGYGIDTMSQFTAEASAAAKELSTTTTEYAKAALIFYQQGLSGEAVTERADVVIKLSQVTGQSAEQVSSQMTAIWNNFDNGTKSLEYYADALTKLGAATAASTDEISDGLEKFAAVAETVGLSYEYAAAAVATVIDKTRQSADVVGTAFKTIFARMQGLSLGETLEDGVDLNKYSEALEKVGVDVLTAEGELRDMDDILNDLGEKWQGFGKETQVALAQTVAGVRQYNQMISLMDNWESVKENIDLAKDATGELTKQQEIWSESYEAAANRVKQAQNELYEQFINDKTIVSLNDTFAGLIKTITGMIDSMGGIGNIVLILVGLFSKSLFPMVQAGFKNLRDNIAVFTGAAAKDIAQMQSTMASQMQSYLNDPSVTEGLRQQVSLSMDLLKAKQKLAEASKGMSQVEQNEAQQRMATAEAITAQVQETLARKKALEDEIKLLENKMLIDNRKIVGQSSAIHQFRSQNSKMSQEDQDDIVESAMSTNLSSNMKELDQLTQRKQLTADMESAQARINQLQDQYNNGVFKNGREKAKVYEKLEQERAILATLEGKGKALTEEEKNRLSYLEKVVQLQKDLSKKGAMSADEVYKASVGTAKLEQDSPSAIHGPDTMRGQYGDAIRANAMQMAGASIKEDGSLEMEASFQGLEKLYSAMAKYGEITATTKAVLQDYANASQQVTASEEALTQAKKASAEASDAVKRAEEKYNQLVARHGKNSAQARTQLTLLNKAKKDAAKANDEVAKAEQKVANSQSAVQKVMVQSKNTVMEMAKSAGLSAQQIAQLEQEFKTLEQGGPNAATAMDNIKTSLSTISQASSETEGSLFELSNSLKEVMVSSGISPEALNTLVSKLEQLKLLSPQAAAEIRNAIAAMREASEIPDPSVKFDKLAVSVASAAGKIGMIVGSMRSVANAFKEGNDPLQTMITLLTSASMIIPALISLQNSLAGSTLMQNAVKVVSNALDAVRNKLIATETGATAGLTVAKWGLVAAEWALKVITDPVGGAIVLGLIIAGTAAIISKTAATKGLTEAQIEQNQSTMDQAEKTNELADAWVDQMSVMDNLIAKYEALRKAGGDYADVEQDIIDAVPETIEAYKALADSIQLTPEQQEYFNKLIKQMEQAAAVGGEAGVAAIQQAQSEMDALLSPAASKNAKEGAAAAMSQTAQAIVNVGDATWKNNKVTRHVGGYATQRRDFYDDEGRFLGGDEEAASGRILDKHGVATQNFNLGGYDVALDTSSTENFLRDYENLRAAQKEMEAVLGDAVDNSDTYREISEMLKGSEKEYEKLVQLQEEAEKFGLIDAKTRLEEQGLTLEGINSYEGYQDYKQNLIKEMAGEDATPEELAEIEAIVDAWLKAQGAVEDYVAVENKIGFAADQKGKEAEQKALQEGKSAEEAADIGAQAAQDEKARLEGIYNSLLTEEDRKLFLQLDFNTFETEAAIRGEIKRLKNIAKEEKIEVQIEKIETAQSTLKESGMTAADWTKIKDETLDWGKNGVMEFNDFMNMTYEEQQQYLKDQMNIQQQNLVQAKQDTLTALQQIDTTKLTDAEKKALDEKIQLAEEELAIQKRIAEQKEIEAEGLDYQEYQEYIKYLQEANPALKQNIKYAQQLAKQYLLTQKGVKKMSDSFDDWTDAIKHGNKDAVRYAKTMKEIKDAYKDVFNTVDPKIIENLNDEFLSSPKMMNLMEKALAGDEQAWNDWEAAVMEQINATTPAFANMSDSMKAQMNELTTMAANLDFSGLQPGADIKDEAFLAKLASMEFATEAAAQAMCDNLSSIGVDAEIEEHTRTVDGYEVQKRQSGVWTITTDTGPVQYYYEGGGTETKDPHTETYYTLKGAKYNGRGVRPGPGTNDNNKGGGGGGAKKHAEKKGSTDRTRYHTVQNQLEDLSAAYDDVSKAADRAFGADRLKFIDDQISATDDLINKQKEYVDALSEDLPKDKAIMESYYNDVIGGVAMDFDENGNILNYDDIEAAMHEKYNEMADKYTEDSEEWQQFEKQYEKVEQYIEQYEETYDSLRDEEGKYQDLLNQRMDLELTKIQYKAELSLNIEDDEIAVIEHQLDMIGENAFKAAEAIELQIEKAEAVYDKIQTNQTALNDILGQQLSQKEIELFYKGDMSTLEGKNFTDNQVQAIKEYRDSLLDLNSEMMDIRDSIQEQVMATFDAWNEKLEQGMSTLEHYNNVLSSYKNIVDTVGKDTLGLSDQFISDLGQAQVSNAIDQVNATRNAYESMVNAQAEAEAALAQAKANQDEESIKYWEDTLASITENAQSAQEELLGSWEAALTAIAEQFDNTVQTIVDRFNDSIYSLGGLEGLSEDFSRQKENADMMLDDYQKIYELSKLSRDINGKLDDTKIIAGKQKLKDLLEKINDLQEDGVEMSQYDLEYLQKEYDLRLAEIELEEAQRAKNTVRMSRDNEGNWSYVYTQNTDAVDSAQQKYEDALYAMQDLSSNYIDEMSEQLISTSQEMQEALAAIRIQDYANINDYYAEVERVQKQYQDELAMQEEELNKAIGNNKILYDTDWTNYHNATGYKISDTKEFATAFKDTLLGTLMGSEEEASNFTGILGSAVDSLTTGLMEAAQVYYINLEEAMNAAGTSTDTFAEDTAANIDAVVEKSKEGAAAVDQMAQEMDEAFGAIIDKVADWQETYGLAMQSIIDANLEVVDSFNKMLETLSTDAGTITVSYDINTAPEGVDPAAFDTGGYTGKWGNAGKLAILHEKELILNQDDTDKLLNAMTYSKMILETIDLNAKQASMGMGQFTPTVIKEDAQQTLEQMVHITAEFPGVNNHYEIEEAFNNLINKASQYANRKI